MRTTVLTLGLLLAGHAATAQETTLRAASAFAPNTRFSENFERFVERVNERGKGVLQIDFVGGPESIPPFEIGSAVQSGIVDMANASGAFYTNLLPLADALKLAEKSAEEMRANGAYAFVDQLHNQAMNAKYLARTGIGMPFHVYLNEPIETADLSGLKVRTTSTYRAFLQALGATPVQTAPGEVYTALERGVVDGYGWPSQGVLDLGWQDHSA